MYTKLEIIGLIKVLTGLHIGGNSSFSAIGAIDSPVIRDIQSGNPIIPGSSLKGKMRTLLAKLYNNKSSDTPNKCPNEDCSELISLFGSSAPIRISRLLFSDMVMSNWDQLKRDGLQTKTEVKYENSINRITSEATPRQIERVVRGAIFPLSIIYEVTDDTNITNDFKILKDGFKLLEADYLGGSGSRGYGKIEFKNLDIKVRFGVLNNDLLEECRKILSE